MKTLQTSLQARLCYVDKSGKHKKNIFLGNSINEKMFSLFLGTITISLDETVPVPVHRYSWIPNSSTEINHL